MNVPQHISMGGSRGYTARLYRPAFAEGEGYPLNVLPYTWACSEFESVGNILCGLRGGFPKRGALKCG